MLCQNLQCGAYTSILCNKFISLFGYVVPYICCIPSVDDFEEEVDDNVPSISYSQSSTDDDYDVSKIIHTINFRDNHVITEDNIVAYMDISVQVMIDHNTSFASTTEYLTNIITIAAIMFSSKYTFHDATQYPDILAGEIRQYISDNTKDLNIDVSNVVIEDFHLHELSDQSSE